MLVRCVVRSTTDRPAPRSARDDPCERVQPVTRRVRQPASPWTAGHHRDIRRSSGPSPLAAVLARVHERHREATDGTVATYIPELGPGRSGLVRDRGRDPGRRAARGRRQRTCRSRIQSISKPLTYGLVLDDLGEARVRCADRRRADRRCVQLRSRSAPATGLPLNPMVNAGAIAAAGLVRQRTTATIRCARPARWRRSAGSPVDPLTDRRRACFDSERDTGHRNRAIAHLLRASGAHRRRRGRGRRALLQPVLGRGHRRGPGHDRRDAGQRRRPTRRPASGCSSTATTRAVLAVMATCGMYDGAGEWLYTVGLPAKSGVSGGLIVVVPGPARDGRVLAAARRQRQQRPRRARVPRPRRRPWRSTRCAADAAAAARDPRDLPASEVGSKRRRTPSTAGRLLATVASAASSSRSRACAQLPRPGRDGRGGSRRRAGREPDVERSSSTCIGSSGSTAPRVDLLAGLLGRLARPGCTSSWPVATVSGRPWPAWRGRSREPAAGRSSSTDDLDAALEVVEDALLATEDDDTPPTPVARWPSTTWSRA